MYSLFNEYVYVLFKYFSENTGFVLFLQDLLTRHKLLSAEFLEQHYDRVSGYILIFRIF